MKCAWEALVFMFESTRTTGCKHCECEMDNIEGTPKKEIWYLRVLMSAAR
jgi:hypothetical protein